MKFTMTIESEGAAFTDDPAEELGQTLQKVSSQALRKISHLVEAGLAEGVVRDTNGNRVGTWQITDGDSDG